MSTQQLLDLIHPNTTHRDRNRPLEQTGPATDPDSVRHLPGSTATTTAAGSRATFNIHRWR